MVRIANCLTVRRSCSFIFSAKTEQATNSLFSHQEINEFAINFYLFYHFMIHKKSSSSLFIGQLSLPSKPNRKLEAELKATIKTFSSILIPLLQDLFSQFGTITSISLKNCFAFVEFSTPSEASLALKSLNGHKFYKSRVR